MGLTRGSFLLPEPRLRIYMSIPAVAKDSENLNISLGWKTRCKVEDQR